MPTSTPAEKSAKTVHLLNGQRSTWCGILFKRQRFFTNNTTASDELCDCAKCTKKWTERAEAKAKDEKKPAKAKKK